MQPNQSFSEDHRRVLRSLVIDAHSPGSLLHDFEALLDHVQQNEPPISGKRRLLALRVLPEINALLAHPIQPQRKRPALKSYPYVGGLFLLLRASGLSLLAGKGNKMSLVLEPTAWQSWQCLNPTERYCALLESWLLRGSAQIVAEDQRSVGIMPDIVTEWAMLFSNIPEGGLTLTDNPANQGLVRYSPGWHRLALLDLFGLLSMQHGLPAEGESWCIERIERTRLGDALLALLIERCFGDGKNIWQLNDLVEIPPGTLQPVLQPFLPAWQNNLQLADLPKREGTLVFKVVLGKVWRRIAVPAGRTMHEFARAILDAVEFDYDHLYEFTYLNRFGVLEQVVHPSMTDAIRANKIRLAELPLPLGHTMRFHYDYGDDWRFDLTLERIDAAGSPDDPIRVLERHGEAPHQYANWID